MSNANRRHVTPSGDGRWNVIKPSAQRVSGNYLTQKEAIAASDRIVRNAGGGETVIHARSGKIRDSKTIAPGNDPFPPRDMK